MTIHLWHLVKDWLQEHNFNFKTTAVIDGTPIYQIDPPPNMPPCTSFLLIKDDEVQITSYRVDITQYNNSIEDLTLTGPVLTVKAAEPEFFKILEEYLLRVPPPPPGYDPSAPPISIINCMFDGTGKTGAMIEIKEDTHVFITGCVFQNCAVLAQLPAPAPPVVLPPNFWVAAPAPVLQFSNPPNYQALQPLPDGDSPVPSGADSEVLLPGTPGMRGTPDQAT